MIYDYEPSGVDASWQAVESDSPCRTFRIEYTSPAPSVHPESDRVVCYYFAPKTRRSRRAVLFFHGMGRFSFRPLLSFPRKLAELGVPALFLVLPCHFERAPGDRPGGTQILRDDLETTLGDFRQAVLDARAALDLMEAHGLGPASFTALGVSFGGMIATITAAVDRRVRGAVLAATAGNMLRILPASPMTRRFVSQDALQRLRRGAGTDHRPAHEQYRRYVHALPSPRALDPTSPLDQLALIDPLTFAPMLRDRSVVMYHAGFDCILPLRGAHDLWKELGRQERHYLPCGHNTIVFFRRHIVRRTAEMASKDRSGRY